MKTKSRPLGARHFIFFESENNGMLPIFVWPSVWVEEKNLGIEIKLTRLTLGFWRYRLHLTLGKTTPILSAPMDMNALGIPDFLVWASAWSKRVWARDAFEKWVMQSDWKKLVKLGGAKYHYSRIVLARDYLSHEKQGVHIISPQTEEMDFDFQLNIISGSGTQDADFSR